VLDPISAAGGFAGGTLAGLMLGGILAANARADLAFRWQVRYDTLRRAAQRLYNAHRIPREPTGRERVERIVALSAVGLALIDEESR